MSALVSDNGEKMNPELQVPITRRLRLVWETTAEIDVLETDTNGLYPTPTSRRLYRLLSVIN
jgi:hypothetical protein